MSVIKRIERLAVAIGVIAFVSNVFVPNVAFAQNARQIARNTFPSVVLLVLEDANGQPLSLGSGFFVGEHVVATNMHVIKGAGKGYAKLIGSKPKYEIEGVLATDTASDLALLKISEVQAPTLTLGESKQVAVGDQVYVVGNPEGLEGTFSQGIVSGIRKLDLDSILQITAPISPGSSGGPVLDSLGHVIGIAVATFKGGQNLNFAVPVSYLKSLVAMSGSASPRALSHLREPVRSVYVLVIFHSADGSQLDEQVFHVNEVIPGGLGKRITGKASSLSIKELTSNKVPDSGDFEQTPATNIEFRILNFERAE